MTPGEAIAFNTDDGLMYHATGDEPTELPTKAYGAGRLFRSLNLDTMALNSITLASQAYSWYEPTAMTYAPGADQFYIASVGGGQWMPSLSRMTLDGGSATEERIGSLMDGMAYPLTINGLAFRYDRPFPAPEVTLDASQSSDPDGDSLLYAWNIVDVPDGSSISLGNTDLSTPNEITTSFTPDVLGAYMLELVVNDGHADSPPATVTVNYLNMAPVANAGANQTIPEGQYQMTHVQADGSQSFDPDGETLTYEWTFLSVPTGSDNPPEPMIDLISAAPSFTAYVASDTEPYVLQLTVTDPDGASSSTNTVSFTVMPGQSQYE